MWVCLPNEISVAPISSGWPKYNIFNAYIRDALLSFITPTFLEMIQKTLQRLEFFSKNGRPVFIPQGAAAAGGKAQRLFDMGAFFKTVGLIFILLHENRASVA